MHSRYRQYLPQQGHYLTRHSQKDLLLPHFRTCTLKSQACTNIGIYQKTRIKKPLTSKPCVKIKRIILPFSFKLLKTIDGIILKYWNHFTISITYPRTRIPVIHLIFKINTVLRYDPETLNFSIIRHFVFVISKTSLYASFFTHSELARE